MGQTGLHVDPRLDEPIYQQIFDQIAHRIRTRAFPAGFKLPASRELARELGAHRNTVARAYADLEAAGFVSGSVGRGTFVEAQRHTGEPGARGEMSEAGEVAPGRASGVLPWNALLARGAHPETLARAERWARRVDGRDVVNFARMQPSADLLPTDTMRRSIERVLATAGADAMTYAAPEGVPALRRELARELGSRGVPARAEDLIVTSGSQQALDLVARSLVNPGDTVLVEATTYSGAIDLFTLAGARLVPVPSDGRGPSLDALQRLVRPEVKALYLMPNAHNPTGATIDTERRRALVAWSRASGVPLIEDDYGAGIALDDVPAPPHLRALEGDVIHLSTFSKRLLPALRIGVIVCPPGLRPALASMKRVVDLGTSSLLQLALADFLERGLLRAHTNRVLLEYRARRDALEEALRSRLPEEVRWTRPTHGVVLWLRLPPSLDPAVVYQEALRAGVLVSPSPMWSVEATPERGLRLAFCAEPPERLALGARRLGKVLKSLLHRGPRGAQTARTVVEVV